jgi:glucokinase
MVDIRDHPLRKVVGNEQKDPNKAIGWEVPAVKENIYCCVDVGGTKILILLIDGERRVLYRDRILTPTGATPEAMVEAISGAIASGLAGCGLSQSSLAGIGLCIAGLVDFTRGEIYQAPNLGWYSPVPLRGLLQGIWPCPAYLENDANAAILGEVAFGAARGHRDAAYITISTGIGGGLFLDGKIYRGSRGFAGEIGHTKPFGKGRPCGCGGFDCLEAWASGLSISRSAQMIWDERTAENGEITTAWVFDQARAGNALARTIIAHALDDIGTGLANLVTLLNPSCLVIGGGVAGNRADFLAQIRDKIYEKAIHPSVKEAPVVVAAAQLEPEAGVWGMYALMNRYTA